MTWFSYQSWEEAQRLGPSSPEAAWAEMAWNAAISQVRLMVKSAISAESNSADIAILIEEELNQMETSFGSGESPNLGAI